MDPNGSGWKLVVPEEHKEGVLREAHCSLSSGHLGIEKTAERVEQAQERQAKAFDQGKQNKTYEVRQNVIRKVDYLSNAEKGVSGKLFSKFEGSYKILEVLSPQTYLLDQPSDCLKLPKVHSSQLKLHVERDPRWKAPENTAPVKKLIEPPPAPTHDRVLRSQTRKQAEGKGQGR